MSADVKTAETTASEPLAYDPQYILMVRDLKKYFPIKGGFMNRVVGNVKAVDGVTFNLKRGTTMGLVGESGCGKTTTGRTILRLTGDKTGGDVLFNGQEVYDLSHEELRHLRTKMQIIFQDPFSSLSPRLLFFLLSSRFLTLFGSFGFSLLALFGLFSLLFLSLRFSFRLSINSIHSRYAVIYYGSQGSYCSHAHGKEQYVDDSFHTFSIL